MLRLAAGYHAGVFLVGPGKQRWGWSRRRTSTICVKTSATSRSTFGSGIRRAIGTSSRLKTAQSGCDDSVGRQRSRLRESLRQAYARRLSSSDALIGAPASPGHLGQTRRTAGGRCWKNSQRINTAPLRRSSS